MAYADVALLADDFDFRQRTAAAYATETVDRAGHQDAPRWAQDHAWDIAAQPGFGDAYAYALNSDVVRPGNNSAVITDAQILAAVQSLLNLEASPGTQTGP